MANWYPFPPVAPHNRRVEPQPPDPSVPANQPARSEPAWLHEAYAAEVLRKRGESK
jgi:hypothetical protein